MAKSALQGKFITFYRRLPYVRRLPHVDNQRDIYIHIHLARSGDKLEDHNIISPQ